MPLNAYLHFNGNCRDVFEFYRSVFGGEYVIFQTFGDAPLDTGVSEADHDKIMHATLSIGDGVLMGSDVPANFGPPREAGTNFSLSYPTNSREETDELFTKISEGGSVMMEPQEMFWGAYFCACTDKFGTNWMFNYDPPRE